MRVWLRGLCAAIALASAAFAADAPTGRLYPSRRCGECHGRQRDEWNTAAHAQAAGDTFKAAVARFGALRGDCEACHVPLLSAGPRVYGDGVGCDACHTAVGPGRRGGVELKPEEARRFGPFKDSKDHHFHRVGYSEFIASGALCSACHEDPGDAGVRTYTTVTEWNAVKGAKTCLECHMPTFTAVAAKGEKERTVGHHDFHGDLERAIAMKLVTAPGELKVELINTGADHALPTGRPERRLLLALEWLDKDGRVLDSPEQRFGRFLVDASSAPAASFTAQRELADTRLFPKRPRVAAFRAPRGAVKVHAGLWYEAFDPQLAALFGVTSVEKKLVVERTEALPTP
jgi:hypothetical protein